MKKFIFLIFALPLQFIIFFPVASGQENTSPIDYSLTTGMSAGFGSSSQSLYNTFVSPRVGYQVNSKLHLSFGTTIATSSYQSFNTPYGDLVFSQPQNIVTSSVFINGSYQVSDKLRVFGSGFRQMEISGKKETVNPRAFDFNSEGIQAGFEYRLNNNMTLGAEIGIRRGNPATMFPGDPFINTGAFNPYRLSNFP